MTNQTELPNEQNQKSIDPLPIQAPLSLNIDREQILSLAGRQPVVVNPQVFKISDEDARGLNEHL